MFRSIIISKSYLGLTAMINKASSGGQSKADSLNSLFSFERRGYINFNRHGAFPHF